MADSISNKNLDSRLKSYTFPNAPLLLALLLVCSSPLLPRHTSILRSFVSVPFYDIIPPLWVSVTSLHCFVIFYQIKIFVPLCSFIAYLVQGCQLSSIQRESPAWTLCLPLSRQAYEISCITNISPVKKHMISRIQMYLSKNEKRKVRITFFFSLFFLFFFFLFLSFLFFFFFACYFFLKSKLHNLTCAKYSFFGFSHQAILIS